MFENLPESSLSCEQELHRMLASFPHSKNLRKHRRTDPGGTFFITKCIFPKGIHCSERMRQCLVDTLEIHQEKKKIELVAFVFMPDHWHILMRIVAPDTLANRIQQITRCLNLFGGALPNGSSWQDGYYDTKIRSLDQFNFVRKYIERNPVDVNLVETKEAYLWSSAFPEHRAMLNHSWVQGFEWDKEGFETA